MEVMNKEAFRAYGEKLIANQSPKEKREYSESEITSQIEHVEYGLLGRIVNFGEDEKNIIIGDLKKLLRSKYLIQ